MYHTAGSALQATAHHGPKQSNEKHSDCVHRTSSHGLQSQWGRFRLGIRQSLLTKRIIKKRDRLSGEGQELLFLKVLQVEGDICHADPTAARRWISSHSKTRLWFLTTSQMPCWSPTSNCSVQELIMAEKYILFTSQHSAKAEIQHNQHRVNHRQGLGKASPPALPSAGTYFIDP